MDKKKLSDFSQANCRIKRLRFLMGVTQKGLVSLGMNPSTLAKLEAGFIQITRKQANELIRIANEKGLFCSFAWLLTGEGEEPYALTPSPDQKTSAPVVEDYKNTRLLHEVIKFTEANPNSTVILIKDESMTPFFHPGDYVGGTPINVDQINELYKAYIIKLKNGLQLVRSVKKLDDDKLKLIKPNTLFNSSEQIVAIKEIHSLYPVVWHGPKKSLL